MLRSAQVRAEFAEEIVVAAPRRFCREHRAPCWFLGKMLRSAEADLEARVLPKCQETAAIRPLHASRCGEMQISA